MLKNDVWLGLCNGLVQTIVLNSFGNRCDWGRFKILADYIEENSSLTEVANLIRSDKFSRKSVSYSCALYNKAKERKIVDTNIEFEGNINGIYLVRLTCYINEKTGWIFTLSRKKNEN